jgi:hypothetical protein
MALTSVDRRTETIEAKMSTPKDEEKHDVMEKTKVELILHDDAGQPSMCS